MVTLRRKKKKAATRSVKPPPRKRKAPSPKGGRGDPAERHLEALISKPVSVHLMGMGDNWMLRGELAWVTPTALGLKDTDDERIVVIARRAIAFWAPGVAEPDEELGFIE